MLYQVGLILSQSSSPTNCTVYCGGIVSALSGRSYSQSSSPTNCTVYCGGIVSALSGRSYSQSSSPTNCTYCGHRQCFIRSVLFSLNLLVLPTVPSTAVASSVLYQVGLILSQSSSPTNCTVYCGGIVSALSGRSYSLSIF